MSEALRQRHLLDPGDPEAALAYASTLVRSGDYDRAAHTLRTALHHAPEAADTGRLLARLASLPPAPPESWLPLHRLRLEHTPPVHTACIVEPIRAPAEDALQVDAEYRIFAALEGGALLDIDVASARPQRQLDTGHHATTAVASLRRYDLLMTLSARQTATLWQLPEGRILRQLERVSCARFGRRRGEATWLVGQNDGTFRQIDLRERSGHLEVLDRSPWTPVPRVPWDVAMDPDTGQVSVIDAMGLRVYPRLGQGPPLENTLPLAYQGGGAASLSPDGHRAVVLTPSTQGHRLNIHDLRSLSTHVLETEQSVQGWRTDPGLTLAVTWDTSGQVRLWDLQEARACGAWSMEPGLIEAWPDSHKRFLWLVYPGRLELLG